MLKLIPSTHTAIGNLFRRSAWRFVERHDSAVQRSDYLMYKMAKIKKWDQLIDARIFRKPFVCFLALAGI